MSCARPVAGSAAMTATARRIDRVSRGIVYRSEVDVVGCGSGTVDSPRPAPSGLALLAHLPKTAGGGWTCAESVRHGEHPAARRGAPPPAPPRSFLAERGEFDRAPAESSLPRQFRGRCEPERAEGAP